MKFVLVLILILISPWFWMLITNFRGFEISSEQVYQLNNQTRLAELNSLRGECSTTLGKVCTIFFNKVVWNIRESGIRIIETFDPKFLWLEGDLDTARSTRLAGATFATIVLLAVFNFLKSQKKLRVLLTLFVLSLPAIFIENHYHTTPRLGVLIFLTWLAGSELEVIFKARNRVWFKLLIVIVLTIEFTYFVHNFTNHRIII